MTIEITVRRGHCTAPSASRIPRWISRFLRHRKTDPLAYSECNSVKIPGRELERLEGTSPHLLADIGVMPASDCGRTSPWRLKDGRHLLLRPPL